MTAEPPMTFQAWLDHYEQQIRPLRGPADEGETNYAAYDEAYNEHLERLHHMVADKVRLLDNATELAAAAAAYLSSLPDFSDFEIDPDEKETWDAAWTRLQRILDVVGAREPCPNYDAGVASCDCNDCWHTRAGYETWLRAFCQEYLRRVQITWEAGGGDDETSRQYYDEGYTATQAVTAEIRRYGLADTGAGL